MLGIESPRLKTIRTRLQTCSRIGKRFDRFSRAQKIVFAVLAFFIILPGSILVIAELGGYGVNGPATSPNSLNYGLVGYWDMEEGSGQVVKDKSGNGNNGTLGADSSVAKDDPVFAPGHDSNGLKSTGMKFDGVDDYVKVPNNSSLETRSVTLSFFVKFNAFPPDQKYFIQKSGRWGVGYRSNKFFFIPWNSPIVYSTTVPALNTWYHIVATYDGNNVENLYVNGVLESTATGNGNQSTTGDFYMGYAATQGDYLNGSMDDVRVYNRAITEDEVRLLYNQKKPILQLKMDEGSGTTLYDDSFNNRDAKIYRKIDTATSGTANTLIDSGNTWTANYWAGQQVSIIYGTGVGQTRTISSNTNDTLTVSQNWTINPNNTSRYAITLPGSNWTDRNGSPAVSLADMGYVGFATPDNAPISGTMSFTLEAWIKTTSSLAQPIMQQRDLSAVSGEYSFQIDAGKVRYWDYAGSYAHNFSSSQTINDGVWHHVVFTRNGRIGSLYVDGALGGSSDVTAVSISSALDFAVGVDFRDAGAASYFNGSIDDVRVYSYARTVDEVKADYNEGMAADLGKNNQNLNKGLIGYWDFEEGQGQTVKDKSGNGNDCTLGVNSSVGLDDPTFAPGFTSNGARGTGLKFDGIDNTVNCGSSATLNPTTAITVQAFIYIPYNYNYQNILSRGWNGAGAWTLETGGGKWSFGLRNQASNYYNAQSSSDILTGKWQQVVGVWDGAQVRIYVNGALQGSMNTTGVIGVDASLSMVGGSIFNGTLDEVRIYNRALSEDEIRTLYNQKKPIFQLKMDEGSGTMARDESFNNNDGTFGAGAAAPTWVAGKFGSALSFDGSNDYIDAGNGTSLNPKYVTVEAWVYPKASYTEYGVIVDKANTAHSNPYYQYHLRFNYDTGSGNITSTSIFVSTNNGWGGWSCSSSVSLNNWHHIVGTFDGTWKNIYIDGVYCGGNDILTGELRTFATNLQVGRFRNLGSGYFNGYIDDVRVYNYARSNSEILTDYNDGQAAHLGKSNQNLNNGLVGYWDMEEGQGQTVKDKSGGGNNGTLGTNSSVGSDDPVFIPGYNSSGAKGTGLAFDGINDHVRLPSIDLLNSYALSSWVYYSDADGIIIDQEMGCVDYPTYVQAIVSGKLTCQQYLSNSSSKNVATFPTSLTPNSWNSITCVFDGLNLKAYVNGILGQSVGTSPTWNSSQPTTIGVGLSQGLCGNYYSPYKGKIDEVRIYNRGLSADEVRTLYNQKKPLLQLKMDEGSGTVVKDESFNNNDGTLGNGSCQPGAGTCPAWAQGKFGTALSFDGNDDYIEIPNSPSIAISNYITVEAWVRHTSYATQFCPIIWKGNGWGYALSLGGTGRNPVFVINNATSVASPSPLSYGVWTHVAGTYDGANMLLYIDGVQVASQAKTGGITTDSGALRMGVASNGFGNTWKYAGLIDDARIYNYARSASEVLSDYSAGQAAHLR